MALYSIAIDLTNCKFGRLTVLERAGTYKKHALWLCLCSCGKTKIIKGVSLRVRNVRSCGCLRAEAVKKNGKLSPSILKKDDIRKHPLYNTWINMRSRCYNINHPQYKDYGGRGILICNEWKENFKQFIMDMGNKPNGWTLERKNNNEGYSKENCIWASWLTQANNRRART